MLFLPELLISPLLPPTLNVISPKKIFDKKWWDEQRKNKGTSCIVCGTDKDAKWCTCNEHYAYKKYLEAHEIYNIDYKNMTVTLVDVVLLCHACHTFIHSGRLVRQYSEGINSRDYTTNILKHGIKILKDAEIKPNSYQAYSYLTIVLGYTKEEAYETLVKKDLIQEKFIVEHPEEWKMIVKGTVING